ncbi:MAG: ABC transporter ATP-binding protein [Thermodesulfovibrio sp. RBG_19FT_COMBO_41_18]|jgi:putative ABC transport system permease protein|nr:MAG: ABC transporter ATP-binding protein [Thermodesulfovibrio sp. RBG_19FT_COMBO_41_18]
MHILKLIFKNAFRHKLRTFLTVLGVTIAILAFGLLRTVISAWYAGVNASSASRLVTRNSISLIFPLPLSYQEKIRQIQGVKTVSYGNWFGGIYIDEKNFFANYAVEPKTYLELYPEIVIPPDQKAAFFRERKGAVAGIKLAAKYGWKIGDLITLKGTIFPGNWDFVLRGIYKGRDETVDETAFVFHWNYLNETLKQTIPRRADQVGWYMIGVSNPNLAADVAVRIDKAFKNSLAETLTETEKSFQLSFISMTEAIVIAIQLVSFVIIFIIMAVVANTMAMTARERIGEYAVFKTLGFSGFHISGLIFGESIFVTMLGAALGIFLTFPVAKIFSQELSTYFPVFNVATETIYMDIAASLLVALVAGIFPSWRAINIRIADGLRRIG